jgi:hypothetical protein
MRYGRVGPDLAWTAEYTPAVARRGGQVVVVSPFPFQAAFDCALSSTVGETPHPVCQGLLPGGRPFHHLPMEPPVRHHHGPIGLCRFCSGARTLARRVPTRPRVSRRGDFPQRPAVAGAVHRQLPSTSWHRREGPTPQKPTEGPAALRDRVENVRDRCPWAGRSEPEEPGRSRRNTTDCPRRRPERSGRGGPSSCR